MSPLYPQGGAAFSLPTPSAGRVAIIDFKPDSPEGPPKEFRFTPEQIKSEMSKAGCTLTAQHDFLPRQHCLIFAIADRPSR